METPDVETTVRALLGAGGLELTEVQVEKYARIYPVLRAAADALWDIPELRYEQPAVVYRAKL